MYRARPARSRWEESEGSVTWPAEDFPWITAIGTVDEAIGQFVPRGSSPLTL